MLRQPCLLLVCLLCLACSSPSKSAQTPDGGDDADVATPDADGGDDHEIWCATQWPNESLYQPGSPTENLYTRVRVAGVTPSGGADAALEVQLGYGPTSEAPSTNTWSWSAAHVNALCAGCAADEDEYMGKLTPEEPGSLLWAARVRYAGSPWVFCDRADDGRSGSADGWNAADAPTLRPPASLSVVTLNLRCLLDDWDARLPLIADALAEADPDLAGFQEMCAEDGPGGRENLAELVSALSARTGRTYSIVRAQTHWSWDTYHEGIALVTAHPVESSGELELPPGAFTRKLVHATVATPQGRILFATTHLDHLDAATRVLQIQAVLAELDALAGALPDLVLTGDFNEGPDGNTHLRMSAAAFSDMWQALHPGDVGYTYPAPTPTIRIDYVWLKSGLSPEQIQQILDVVIEGVTGSDHFGLWGLFRP
ncbi:MAG: hypothetical protein CVU65_10920 [Deltaproteobacteria bacterium HGW-Deltaproteobacteria-22]|nr:MAG: hypothetical protein CVU65_10920 [Deltaproteobacteria bacterium HGW-Deltaproteobacteria-22]